MLKIALEKGFQNPQVYATLSRAQWLKDQNDEAIESMKKALELDPLNAEYYLGLARAQGGTGYRIGEETSPEARRSQWLALEVARATSDPAEYAILIDLGPEFTKPDPALPPAK
jgi:tetratricopeptide (TPR) repeat protein